jgi:hypothetical protein
MPDLLPQRGEKRIGGCRPVFTKRLAEWQAAALRLGQRRVQTAHAGVDPRKRFGVVTAARIDRNLLAPDERAGKPGWGMVISYPGGFFFNGYQNIYSAILRQKSTVFEPGEWMVWIFCATRSLRNATRT